MIERSEFTARISKARELMARAGIDVLAVDPGSDMAYLCGYDTDPHERVTLLVLGHEGAPRLLVPALEAARVDDQDRLLDVVPWADGEDMISAAADEIRRVSNASARVAVADHLWANVLLGLQGSLEQSRFSLSGELLKPMRMHKSREELDLLGRAALAIDTVVSQLSELDWVGRTESELAAEIAELILGAGHDTVEFVIVASGPNAASPHHTAADRTIGPGDVIVVDIGGSLSGYCSDTTRCITIGEPGEEVSTAYAALCEAQEAAVQAVRPGSSAESVDAAARGELSEAGYGEYFIHRTGHGIGLDVHEHPYIVEGNHETLGEGMCFSIEPGIYVPGRFGLRLEDIVAVTREGVARLNTTSHDLIVV